MFAVAASLVLIMFIGLSINPALAESIPVLNQLSNSLKKIYWFNDNYITYADKMNLVQDKKGIKIELEGVVYDESSLKFIYTLTSSEKLQWGVQLKDVSLRINGKNILADSQYSRVISDETKLSQDSDKNDKYAVITTYDVSDLKFDNNVPIDWNIGSIHLWGDRYAKGNWDFKFKASKAALQANIKVVDANKVIRDIDGYKAYIGKIIFTPTEIKITTSIDKKLSQDLAKADDAYEKDKSNSKLQEKAEHLRNIQTELMVCLGSEVITDEKGNELRSSTGKGDNNRGIELYHPLKEIPNKLIFTHLDYSKISDGYGNDDFGIYTVTPLKQIKTPLEFVQGDNMSIVINSIENNNGKLKVNATFRGDYAAGRITQLPILVLPEKTKVPSNKAEVEKMYKLINSTYDTNKTDIGDYYKAANTNNNTFDFYYNIESNEDYSLWLRKIPAGYYDKDKQLVIDIK
ncbi:MAG: DUF4179 domain-containing protein, partial [Bacillota bacterium]|nr:DUF4179 domain-containing protein [Bacillota bacterium]